MSFDGPSQRGLDHAAADLQHPQSRMQGPGSPYPPYSQTSLHRPPSPGHTHSHLPKIGETRCYWTLLSSDLHFIYLDPVLASHLEEQADALVGKSLLSFVHPVDRETARKDLGEVLETRTLHGSVTRVRYSRLSRVRRQLGYQGPEGTPWTDGDKVALDSNYMIVDIVINWAADGLVLCFMHAVVDLTPSDNDQEEKTGWTNWCRTPPLGPDQIDLLYQRLLVCLPQTGNSTRLFQIMANESDRSLIISWPPEQGNQQPSARDFAKLVDGASFEGDTRDAKTNCTRRLSSKKCLQGISGQVESIFVVHGSVIFGCHKIHRTLPPLVGYTGSGYTQPSSQYYDTYDLPPPSTYNNYLSHTSQSSYSPPHWSQGPESSSTQPSYNQWPHSPSHSIASLPSSNFRPASFPPPEQEHWPAHPPYASETNYPRTPTPTYNHPSGGGSDCASTASDVVPAKRRHHEAHAPRSNNNHGNRPHGVLKCSSCSTTQSPEWRKGPSGKKELCNACGLRYARSRAKKEGTSGTQRRRKDRGMTIKRSPSVSSASALVYPPSSRRGGHDDASFVSTSSTGSGSSGDVYAHGHRHLDRSPSPPASSVSFVHYAHPPPPSQAPDSRYPAYYPLPLSNHDDPHHHAPQHHGHHHAPVSRAGQGSHSAGYTDRLMPSSSPPTSHATLHLMAPASFERSRNRERAGPLTTEPRYSSGRSIVATQD